MIPCVWDALEMTYLQENGGNRYGKQKIVWEVQSITLTRKKHMRDELSCTINVLKTMDCALLKDMEKKERGAQG